jgi:hypothetical protein
MSPEVRGANCTMSFFKGSRNAKRKPHNKEKVVGDPSEDWAF